MATLVKMLRDDPQHQDGPVIAAVHPDEVDNWKLAGWVVAPKKVTKGKSDGLQEPEQEQGQDAQEEVK